MFPKTEERVQENTHPDVNERLRREAENRVRRCVKNPGEIDACLQRLDHEWDIERTLEANAATVAFAGVALGAFVHPYFLLLPALVTAFLFQHAVQGWCPPLPILRRLGFRTAKEIGNERNALKALRGDYRIVGPGSDPVEGARVALKAASA